MKSISTELRELNGKHWTQKRLSEVFGISRTAVSHWFNRDRSNDTSVNASNVPDARVKVNPKHKPVIAERVSGGESQQQVAAD